MFVQLWPTIKVAVRAKISELSMSEASRKALRQALLLRLGKKSEVRFSFFPKLRPQKSEVDGD